MNQFRHCFISLSLVGLLTFILFTACDKSGGRNFSSKEPLIENCRTVQHEMGETCIPRNPQRVVTLWTTILANSLALGVKPIASTYYTGEPFPHYLQGKADGVELLGDISQPSLEKILQLKPDLILVNSRLSNIYEPLSKIASTVVLFFPVPPPPWKQELEELAKVLDKENAAKQLMAQYWRRVEDLKQALSDRRNPLQISVASISEDYGIWVYGENHPVGIVLNDVGLQRPPTQRGDFFYIENISKERLSDLDGDTLFFVVRREEGTEKILQQLQQDPLWQKLKVVQRNRVYFVDSGHWHGLDILAMNAVIDDLFKYLVNIP